jgi:hypothetical protein
MTIHSPTSGTSRRLAAFLLKTATVLTFGLAASVSVAQTAGSYSVTNILSDG